MSVITSRKLTRKVVVLMTAFGLVPLIVLALVVYRSLGGLKEQAVAEVASVSEVLAEQIDREMAAQVTSIKALSMQKLPGPSAHWYRDDASNPLVPMLDRYVVTSPGALFAMMVGPDGRVIGASGVDPERTPLHGANIYQRNFRSSDWFKRAIAGQFDTPHAFRAQRYGDGASAILVGDPQVSELVESVYGRRQPASVSLVTPVYLSDGKPAYWVSFISFGRIESIIEQQARQLAHGLDANIAVLMMDSEGRLAAEYDAKAFAADEGFNRDRDLVHVLHLGHEGPAGARHAFKGHQGVTSGPNRSGQAGFLSGYTHLRGTQDYPGVKWSLVVQAREADVFAAVGGFWRTVILTGLATLPWLLLGGYLLGRSITGPVVRLSRNVEPMSQGDFSGIIDVVGRDELSEMGHSLNNVSIAMSRVLGSVSRSSVQIVGTSAEISGASAKLADNALCSAAALEEISASMTSLSSRTQRSAENASSALALSQRVSKQAEESNRYMEQMVGCMDEISLASERIGKIIQVIDDIAFQTNLLALNAAVEAARAGVHGKGFAVVAEEVRTLAARSAKAARETTALIQDSLCKVGQGSEVARTTADSLGDIVSGAVQVSTLMSKVASASSEQARGISEINQGLLQVDNGVQGNTASAAGLAASARELKSRSSELETMVAGLRFRGPEVPTAQLEMDALEAMDGDYDQLEF